MKVLKVADVVEKTGLSSSSIERREKDGTFPVRRTMGPRSVGWLESEIDAWIEAIPTKEQQTATEPAA